MKKLFSLAMVMIMALALCVPAFAADVTIKSSNNTDATYKAYKILNLTTVLTCKEEHDHHEATESESSCYGYAYTVNSKYTAAITAFINGNTAAKAAYNAAKAATNPSKTEDEAVIAALSAATGREIADGLYAQVKNMTADATLAQGTAKDLAQGYWLIVDSTTLTDEEGKTISKSLVILDTAGQEDISIVAKDDSMTLDKDVNGKETEDTVDVGDTVTFTITTGAIPTLISEYDSYTFIINDTMSKGLEYVTDSLVVKVGSKTLASTDYTSSIGTYSATNGTSIQINLSNYILANDPADQVVTVEYKAVLNKDAVLGSAGNMNAATLTFTNNPDENQNGTTVPSEVKVYAAKIIIDKYDGAVADKSVKLAGAQFKLYKMNGDNKLYYSVDATTKDVSWDASAATIMTTDENGDAEFAGLKAGTYYLEEVAAPTGYNLLADPIEVVISATGDSAYANQEAAVANNTGVELPSTGGMGTTIFYTVGGILMAGAAILLITKKKMANEQ